MDGEEFRIRGREMIDYITEYLDGITSRPPYPKVSPGYLRELIPDQAPRMGESWAAVKADIERVIMPGVSQPDNIRLFLDSNVSNTGKQCVFNLFKINFYVHRRLLISANMHTGALHTLQKLTLFVLP